MMENQMEGMGTDQTVIEKKETITKKREKKTKVPFQTLQNTVIVKEQEIKNESGLIIPEAVQKSMTQNSLLKYEVVSVGPLVGYVSGTAVIPDNAIMIKVGDTVRAHNNTYMADFTEDGITYYIFPERNILTIN